MMKTTLQKIYMGLIFLFLYAPIATLMVLSFNASKTRAKWGGFTLKWYQALFRNSDILNALRNTLLIALVASIAATVIGTAACISIMSLKKKKPDYHHWHHKYSHAECRDRNRNFPNVAFFELRAPIRPWHDPVVPHYLLHSLCDP